MVDTLEAITTESLEERLERVGRELAKLAKIATPMQRRQLMSMILRRPV